ncbi:MAG: FumA C-terminus/TtdB family hydratase beta subunit [Candidatus Hadarchaeales archaeon]
MREILLPAGEELKRLRAGEFVRLTGLLYTARDRTYRKILETLRGGGSLPVDLRGGAVYHCGPIVVRRGGGYEVLSCGPTTSSRLDEMQEEFVRRTGVRILVGKGGMDPRVARRVSGLGCVYLAFTGGAGALAASFVRGVRGVHWPELGVEAMWVLEVREFGPLLVVVDAQGRSLHSRMKGI